MRGLDDWINRCTACGSTDCGGACLYEKPRDGDSYDDAHALDDWDDEAGLSAIEKLMFE